MHLDEVKRFGSLVKFTRSRADACHCQSAREQYGGGSLDMHVTRSMHYDFPCIMFLDHLIVTLQYRYVLRS